MTPDELNAIKARIPKYGGGDMRALVAEVERLRGEVAENEGVFRVLRRREQEAKAEERAAVVAWLRERHADTQESDGFEDAYDNAVSSTYKRAADAIERGEHRCEEEP